jgi:hypothetical protein
MACPPTHGRARCPASTRGSCNPPPAAAGRRRREQGARALHKSGSHRRPPARRRAAAVTARCFLKITVDECRRRLALCCGRCCAPPRCVLATVVPLNPPKPSSALPRPCKRLASRPAAAARGGHGSRRRCRLKPRDSGAAARLLARPPVRRSAPPPLSLQAPLTPSPQLGAIPVRRPACNANPDHAPRHPWPGRPGAAPGQIDGPHMTKPRPAVDCLTPAPL